MTLEQFFEENIKIALAFSGGVDSAYLLYAARSSGAQVQAYYVKTPFQPQFEWEDAQRLARQLGADMTVLELDILADSTVAANSPERCYFCKKRLFAAICDRARQDGFSLVIDGTNASDDAADRPGMRALQELQVRSPLRECGLTKGEIRARSKQAGLFTHDKPAYACLATRIPTGRAITEGLIAKTERSEALLTSLGFSDFRVRLLGDSAKLQIREAQLPLFLQQRERILGELKKDYCEVLLDLEVRQ